jgi:hypothetical protein
MEDKLAYNQVAKLSFDPELSIEMVQELFVKRLGNIFHSARVDHFKDLLFAALSN